MLEKWSLPLHLAVPDLTSNVFFQNVCDSVLEVTRHHSQWINESCAVALQLAHKMWLPYGNAVSLVLPGAGETVRTYPVSRLVSTGLAAASADCSLEIQWFAFTWKPSGPSRPEVGRWTLEPWDGFAGRQDAALMWMGVKQWSSEPRKVLVAASSTVVQPYLPTWVPKEPGRPVSIEDPYQPTCKDPRVHPFADVPVYRGYAEVDHQTRRWWDSEAKKREQLSEEAREARAEYDLGTWEWGDS